MNIRIVFPDDPFLVGRRNENKGPVIVMLAQHSVLTRRNMTLLAAASSNDDLSSVPVDADVYRQLLQQFYEKSIERYGVESDQTRMLKMHLNAHSA